jgi:Fic family protein
VVTNYGTEKVRAFLSPPLPPDPPVRLAELQQLLEQASQAIGRLDGLASMLPDISLLIYTYIRKEAVVSSQIEGTQSSLSDLLLFENDDVTRSSFRPRPKRWSNAWAASNSSCTKCGLACRC